jgi:hypothetical protein
MPKFDLLRHAAKIISGIPSKRFNMAVIAMNLDDRTRVDDPFHCGTVGCALGWLGMHPDMRALGLKTEVYMDGNDFVGGAVVKWKGESEDYATAASRLFDIPRFQATHLFQASQGYERWPERWPDTSKRPLSDKQIFRARLRTFFKAHGERL